MTNPRTTGGHDAPFVPAGATPNPAESVYVPETVWGYAEGPGYEAVSGWCATKEAAAAEGRAELGLDTSDDVYVYAGTVPDPASMFDVDDIVERAAERAGDNWPECAEDWPDVSPAALAELEAFLAGWARKHAPCRFYVCHDGGERVAPPSGGQGAGMTTDANMKSLARLPGENDLAYWARITTPSQPTVRDAAPTATPDDGPRLTEEQLRAGRERAFASIRPMGGKAKR